MHGAPSKSLVSGPSEPVMEMILTSQGCVLKWTPTTVGQSSCRLDPHSACWRNCRNCHKAYHTTRRLEITNIATERARIFKKVLRLETMHVMPKVSVRIVTRD